MPPHWAKNGSGVPRSKLMAQEHCVEGRRLTDEQVQSARIELAQDMVYLLARDGKALPPPLQTTLRRLYEQVTDLRRQLRALP